jgi:hypothetical protein
MQKNGDRKGIDQLKLLVCFAMIGVKKPLLAIGS